MEVARAIQEATGDVAGEEHLRVNARVGTVQARVGEVEPAVLKRQRQVLS
jgi:hypothetical protein